MNTHLRAALTVFVLLALLTGVVYPVIVTLVAQGIFPHQANGSVLVRDGKAVGSELIGQHFDASRYFWGRPSATAPTPYNAASSTGSNLGPTNSALLDAVRSRVEAIRQAHQDQTGPVPVELVTASASGLDPHISPAAAEYQVTRVARARGMTVDEVRRVVARHTDGRTIGLLGEPRINVLRLNLALDGREE
ncbi:MAG: potassium-transporting ATPase subunit KdpC [Gemmataceae bacterium]|nr:potassium-transporting ATPase subunit KdpC [Gemmataceae bacterium]